MPVTFVIDKIIEDLIDSANKATNFEVKKLHYLRAITFAVAALLKEERKVRSELETLNKREEPFFNPKEGRFWADQQVQDNSKEEGTEK